MLFMQNRLSLLFLLTEVSPSFVTVFRLCLSYPRLTSIFLRLIRCLALQPRIASFFPPLIPLSSPFSPLSPVSHLRFTICCHSLPIRFRLAPFSRSCPSSHPLLVSFSIILPLSVPSVSPSISSRLHAYPVSPRLSQISPPPAAPFPSLFRCRLCVHMCVFRCVFATCKP